LPDKESRIADFSHTPGRGGKFDDRFVNKGITAGTPGCPIRFVSDDIKRDQFLYLLFIRIIMRPI
jgi:hypothetical protein